MDDDSHRAGRQSAAAAADHTWRLKEGRWSGVLLLAQIAGLIGPFVLLLPLVRLAPGQVLGPGDVTQFQVACLWLGLNSLMALAITVVSWRSLTEAKDLRALLLALSVSVMVFQFVDNAHLFALITLHTQPSGPSETTSALALVTEAQWATRGWVHRSELLAVDLWIATFYCATLRGGLLPRWLSLCGLVTVGLHFSALVVPMYLGREGFAPLGATMALTHLASGLFLVARGYGQGRTL